MVSAGVYKNLVYGKDKLEDGTVVLAGKIIKKKSLPTAQDIIDEIIWSIKWKKY